MSDILNTFKERAEQLIGAINDRGGIRATIDGLRRQMAEADRRREMAKIRSELRRLDAQITEMITAVGVQAVGLHKSGHLSSPELAPLCQHIVELEAAVAQLKTELAKLEVAAQAERAAAQAEKVATADEARVCASCGQPLPEGSTFCPNCGAEVVAESQPATYRFCPRCGAELRPGARFCAKCGHDLGGD